MKNEIYHPLNIVGCECSINSIDYDASDLAIVLDRFDNNQQITIRFNICLPRHFRTFQNYRDYGWSEFSPII